MKGAYLRGWSWYLAIFFPLPRYGPRTLSITGTGPKPAPQICKLVK
jgi:hypothetical protein